MTMLSNQTIRSYVRSGAIRVEPAPEDIQFQPCTLDLRVDIDSLNTCDMNPIMWGRNRQGDDFIMIEKGRLYLACTKERIWLPNSIAAQLMGRSSLARLGLVVHQTGGFIDPGFTGHITLELSCVDQPVTLVRDQRVCQLGFYLLDHPTEQPYRGKYQDNVGVQASKIQEDT